MFRAVYPNPQTSDLTSLKSSEANSNASSFVRSEITFDPTLHKDDEQSMFELSLEPLKPISEPTSNRPGQTAITPQTSASSSPPSHLTR